VANQNSSNPSSGVAHAHELCYRPLPRTLRPLIRTAGTRCRIITQPADDAISIAKANAYNEKHKLLLTALIQVYVLRSTSLCLAKPVSDPSAVVAKSVPRTSAGQWMCPTEHSAIWLLPSETIHSKSGKATTIRYAYGCSKKELNWGKEVCLMLASTFDKLAEIQHSRVPSLIQTHTAAESGPSLSSRSFTCFRSPCSNAILYAAEESASC